MTAWVEPTGELVVQASTQGTFAARARIAQLLGLTPDRIRVQAAPLGGGFGGKTGAARAARGRGGLGAQGARCAWP